MPLVGTGFDFHKLCTFKKGLVLFGVKFPELKKTVAHSDGDAGVHSIIDALLSATQKGDIGSFFGINTEELKDVSSLELLKKLVQDLTKEGYKVVNLSSIIIADQPKIVVNRKKFVDTLIPILGTDKINISGKTSEKKSYGTGPYSSAWFFQQSITAISTVLVDKIP